MKYYPRYQCPCSVPLDHAVADWMCAVVPLSQPQISKPRVLFICGPRVLVHISPQTRFFGPGVAILRSHFMNSLFTCQKYSKFWNTTIQQVEYKTRSCQLDQFTCSILARRGLFGSCPEPPERQCLSRRMAPRTGPTILYSWPPVQMQSASSVR